MTTKDTKQYNPTYTPEDIANVEKIRAWMKENENYSQAALGRLACVNAGTLSVILKGSYNASPKSVLAQVVNAIDNVNATPNNSGMLVKTSVYKLAVASCQMARRYHSFSIFTGYVGTGKSFALRHYATTTPNTFIIDSTPTMTAQSLVKLLASTVLGTGIKGSLDERFRAVVDAIKGSDTLIIVDEAETLTANQLHTLRRLRDLASIGVVFAGTEHLAGMIKPAHGQFDQIRSRCGFWPETVRAITREDADALSQSFMGDEDVADDVFAQLFAYCKGSARMLTEALLPGLHEYRKGRPLDVKLVDAVAQQALRLQSLA